MTRAVQIPDGNVQLEGDLRLTSAPAALIVFAHGSGSSRHSMRNRDVAEALTAGGFATLLLDLLTAHEESIDQFTHQFRFDVPRLGRRVIAAIDWAARNEELAGLSVACFGASTGAAAALIAAAERPQRVAAVVSRGGRPDLADEAVIELNQEAKRRMPGLVQLEIIPGASHLFEEPGTLEQVSTLALRWFTQYSVSKI